MRKGLIALCFMAASSAASAQSDYSLVIDIPTRLDLVDGYYHSMELDIEVYARYLAANGGLISNTGGTSPATGTCFFTASDGIYCNLQVDHLSVEVIIQSNFHGNATIKSATGGLIDSAAVQITSLN